MMLTDAKFKLEDIVYLKTDPEQRQRIVTAITIRSLGVIYELSFGVETSSHYDYECSLEKNVLIDL
ncbi:MAG: hypothetical protein ACWA5P_02080 [bacterium]